MTRPAPWKPLTACWPRAVPRETLAALCAFMATVRRRIAPELEGAGLARLHTALGLLLDGREDTTTTDQRISACCAQFPADREHRWVRDFAAEHLPGEKLLELEELA